MAIVDSWETFPDGQEHIVRTFCTVCGSQLEGGANVCFYCLEDQEEGEEEMTDKVFLLSAEEAEALPKYIRACGGWWWSRTPSDHAYGAAGVFGDGYGDSYGSNVFTGHGVRPAFYLFAGTNRVNEVLHIGDMTYRRMDIGREEPCYLADGCVEAMPFGETGDWETSAVRAWLNGEFLETVRAAGFEPLEVDL